MLFQQAKSFSFLSITFWLFTSSVYFFNIISAVMSILIALGIASPTTVTDIYHQWAAFCLFLEPTLY